MIGKNLFARYKRCLEELTPGGSEFVDDPERCAEFVKRTRETLMKQFRLRVESQARLAKRLNLAAELAELVMAVPRKGDRSLEIDVIKMPTPSQWAAICWKAEEFREKAGDRLICDTGCSNVEMDDKEIEANAAFIVRAVNNYEALLHACKTVLEHVEDNQERLPPGMCRLCYSHRKLLRDALSKAEEETQ